jgi:YtoQ family protein
MNWAVYLSGEIHTDWRQQISDGVNARDLPIIISSAVTDHEASDAAGNVLGHKPSKLWRDHKSSNHPGR